MKMLVLIFLLLTTWVSADNLAPVIWTHTASGKEVFVAVYWSEQFPDRQEGEGRHLIFLCAKTTWQGYDQSQRDWIKGGIADLLAGTKRLDRANLIQWVTPAANRGITFVPVGPQDAKPAFQPALYFVICPPDKRATTLLAEWGLEPPSDEETP